MMKNPIFDLENGGWLIHEFDLYTSLTYTQVNTVIGNRTSCHPILSAIIFMIDKLDSCFVAIQFC